VDFDAMLEQVLELLQRQGRVSYRAIKRRFHVDDEHLEDLKEEILFVYPHIVDEAGRGLTWTGEAASNLSPGSPQPTPQTAPPKTQDMPAEPASAVSTLRLSAASSR
jgi:hypothetical protein